MRRVDLTESPAVRMARMLREQDARLGRVETRPAGVKDLGADGDIRWPDPDGGAYSLKGLPARIDAGLAEGFTTTSRRNTVSTSLPGSVEGFPDGAWWVQIVGVDDQTVQGVWRLTDGAWVEQPYDGGMVAPTIDAGLINVAVLAARLMVTQVLRTETDPDTGRYAIFAADGVQVIDTDGANSEGQPEVIVALGPYADMLLQLGTGSRKVSINSAGGGSFHTLDTQEFRVGGLEIADLLWPYPRGIVGSGFIPKGEASARRQGRAIIMGVDAVLEPGRVYTVATSNLSISKQANTVRPAVSLHVTLDGTDPSLDWAGTSAAESLGVPDASRLSISHPGMEAVIDLRNLARGGPGLLCRIAVALTDLGNGGWVQGTTGAGPFHCLVRDEGVTLPNTGAIWLDDNATPPAPTQRHSKRYWATGIATYIRGGGRDDSQGPTQGQYSSWNRETFIFFPDMTGDLAGAEIHSVTAFSWFDHWYNSAGGTGSWCWHGHTSEPAGGSQFAHYMRDEPGWPRGAGRAAEMIAADFDGWKSGTRRGIAFSTGNTSLEFYGKPSSLVGVNGAHWIDVSYSK